MHNPERLRLIPVFSHQNLQKGRIFKRTQLIMSRVVLRSFFLNQLRIDKTFVLHVHSEDTSNRSVITCFLKSLYLGVNVLQSLEQNALLKFMVKDFFNNHPKLTLTSPCITPRPQLRVFSNYTPPSARSQVWKTGSQVSFENTPRHFVLFIILMKSKDSQESKTIDLFSQF